MYLEGTLELNTVEGILSTIGETFTTFVGWFTEAVDAIISKPATAIPIYLFLGITVFGIVYNLVRNALR